MSETSIGQGQELNVGLQEPRSGYDIAHLDPQEAGLEWWRFANAHTTDPSAEVIQRPLKILHVTKSLQQGGIETMVHRLSHYLNESGHHNTVLTFAEEPQTIGTLMLRDNIQIINAGIDAPTLEADPTRSLIMKNLLVEPELGKPYEQAVADSIEAGRPDVVVSWHAKTHLLCTNVQRTIDNPPSMMWVIGGVSQEQYLLPEEADAFREWSGEPERVIYCGDMVKEFCLKNGMAGWNAIAIPNGVDTDLYAYSEAGRQKVRDELGIDLDDKVIAFVARYAPMKDVPTFIEAAKKLMDKRDDCTVIMCGQHMHEDNEELTGMIDGKNDRFKLLGVREDTVDILSASDVLANTSTFGEGLSVALLEAMACGCTPVATDVGDARFAISGAGILTRMGDSEQIKHDLGKALDRNDRETPRNRMIERYSLQAMATRFLRECEIVTRNEVLYR